MSDPRIITLMIFGGAGLFTLLLFRRFPYRAHVRTMPPVWAVCSNLVFVSVLATIGFLFAYLGAQFVYHVDLIQKIAAAVHWQ
jgi:hypothetical protein